MTTTENVEPTAPTPPPDRIEAVMADLTAWLRPLIEGWLARGGAAEPRWVRVGDKTLNVEKMADVSMMENVAYVYTIGADGSTPIFGENAAALWGYVTDPVRCLDLTPKPDPVE
jgi:hypothetical protein